MVAKRTNASSIAKASEAKRRRWRKAAKAEKHAKAASRQGDGGRSATNFGRFLSKLSTTSLRVSCDPRTRGCLRSTR